jgi:hypothetical protein
VADLCLDNLLGGAFKEMGKIGSMKYEVEKDEVAYIICLILVE